MSVTAARLSALGVTCPAYPSATGQCQPILFLPRPLFLSTHHLRPLGRMLGAGKGVAITDDDNADDMISIAFD